MSDIVDILDSTPNNGNYYSLVFLLKYIFFFIIDPFNLNAADSDSDESGETPFQRLVRLHASPSNYNERFFFLYF
jgi:hypothetical protein